jgi:hypothetical protein
MNKNEVYEVIRLSKETIGLIKKSHKPNEEVDQILEKDEKRLLDTRSKLPIEEVEVHLKLARQLFDLYAIGYCYNAMNQLIEETIKILNSGQSHPLFEVDRKNYSIKVKRNILCFEHNIKYIEQALELFPPNEFVYCEISPFGFGTECICYKSSNEKTKKIILHNDDSSSEELRILGTINEVKNTHQKVKIYFTFGDDDNDL